MHDLHIHIIRLMDDNMCCHWEEDRERFGVSHTGIVRLKDSKIIVSHCNGTIALKRKKISRGCNSNETYRIASCLFITVKANKDNIHAFQIVQLLSLTHIKRRTWSHPLRLLADWIT